MHKRYQNEEGQDGGESGSLGSERSELHPHSQQTPPRTGMHVLLLLRTVQRGAALGLVLRWVDRSPKAEPLKAGSGEEGQGGDGQLSGHLWSATELLPDGGDLLYVLPQPGLQSGPFCHGPYRTGCDSQRGELCAQCLPALFQRPAGPGKEKRR